MASIYFSLWLLNIVLSATGLEFPKLDPCHSSISISSTLIESYMEKDITIFEAKRGIAELNRYSISPLRIVCDGEVLLDLDKFSEFYRYDNEFRIDVSREDWDLAQCLGSHKDKQFHKLDRLFEKMAHLLSQDANPNVLLCYEGRLICAYAFAIENNLWEIADLLKEYGAVVDERMVDHDWEFIVKKQEWHEDLTRKQMRKEYIEDPENWLFAQCCNRRVDEDEKKLEIRFCDEYGYFSM